MSVLEPPRTFARVLRRLGPGLIVAGSIVGSGELIATTKVGAEAGFTLLWLIAIGCVIKVFTQVELGRATISGARTALEVLDDLPGPRLRAGWAVWLWLVMTLLTLAQQGGVVGGVGQALSIAAPLTAEGRAFQGLQDERVAVQRRAADETTGEVERAAAAAELARLEREIEAAGAPPDPYLWATLAALPTAAVLVIGRYSLIQLFSTVLVATFTLMTVVAVGLLQTDPAWAIRGGDLFAGLRFDLPAPVDGRAPLGTALATFGIIGVGAAELIMYPYWCLEKGYARWTGPREATDAWRRRARGWLRVLKADAWLSAVVYTFATIAFYLLGAAVLGRTGLDPAGEHMIRTLAEMYEPAFGAGARVLFLAGAVAVLYSTFFVASAGIARVAADAMFVFSPGEGTDEGRRFWSRVFCGLFPLLSLTAFVFVRAPAQLVLASGVAQAAMLPVLGFAALWLRYRRTEPALRPGKAWDAMLWLSFAGFVVAGGWALATRLFPGLGG